jgi:hypothetical protein
MPARRGDESELRYLEGRGESLAEELAFDRRACVFFFVLGFSELR